MKTLADAQKKLALVICSAKKHKPETIQVNEEGGRITLRCLLCKRVSSLGRLEEQRVKHELSVIADRGSW